MRINKRLLDEVKKRIDAVSAAGRSTMEQVMINAPMDFQYETLFPYVAEHYLPIVETCDDNAAVVGASAYDAYREIETGEAMGAEAYSIYDHTETENAAGAFINNACAKQDMGMLVDYLGRRIDSEIMRSFTNTQIQNGAKDGRKPRFARVPMGGNTCEFCRALAGHGFYYTSKEAAGEFSKFHDFCRCQVVPEFSAAAKKLTVQGYDPDVYKREWQGTRTHFGGKAVKMRPGGTSPKSPVIEKPVLTEKPRPAELPAKVFGGEWNQKEDMETFLKTMFDDDDYVGVCGQFYTNDKGRRVPTRGFFQRNAGQIENVLNRTGNVAAAVGRYNRADGAYVRINPLDGKGISDANVKKFKYALIECDTLPMAEQYGYIKALNLPTQAVVTSGGKSVHAVVLIDAKDIEEYRERVAILQAECKAAGFDIDTSTKNPSRYMRLPGVRRGDGRQALVSTKEGATSWDSWRTWCDQQRS